jgi:hypothetical protein
VEILPAPRRHTKRRRRFNGTTFSQTWKSFSAAAKASASSSASMEPRFLKRGNPQLRPDGQVIRHQDGFTAFILELEIECVSGLPEAALRNLFGVNFVTPEGFLTGETHGEGGEIVDYMETRVEIFEG